jgi:tRNA-Thr(GGU) m(6)t(6)A37 methyltransferase TsaA
MHEALEARPIGVVHTSKRVRFAARHQPDPDAGEHAVLELFPGPGMRDALRDLEGMERIWLVWWFHRVGGWRPLVLPPRGPARRRGVLATRSPHRPNPIGITPVRLLAIEELCLRLGPCDLLEGTPVLDIKPYVPAFDAFPGSRAGWIDDVEDAAALPPRFVVEIGPVAREQLDWLRDAWDVDFEGRMESILATDPSPHRSRRIRARPGGAMEMGCGAWKIHFDCDIAAARVKVHRVEPSFPERFLRDMTLTRVPDRAAQLAFMERWPAGTGT